MPIKEDLAGDQGFGNWMQGQRQAQEQQGRVNLENLMQTGRQALSAQESGQRIQEHNITDYVELPKGTLHPEAEAFGTPTPTGTIRFNKALAPEIGRVHEAATKRTGDVSTAKALMSSLEQSVGGNILNLKAQHAVAYRDLAAMVRNGYADPKILEQISGRISPAITFQKPGEQPMRGEEKAGEPIPYPMPPGGSVSNDPYTWTKTSWGPQGPSQTQERIPVNDPRHPDYAQHMKDEQEKALATGRGMAEIKDEFKRRGVEDSTNLFQQHLNEIETFADMFPDIKSSGDVFGDVENRLKAGAAAKYRQYVLGDTDPNISAFNALGLAALQAAAATAPGVRNGQRLMQATKEIMGTPYQPLTKEGFLNKIAELRYLAQSNAAQAGRPDVNVQPSSPLPGPGAAKVPPSRPGDRTQPGNTPQNTNQAPNPQAPAVGTPAGQGSVSKTGWGSAKRVGP